jgi:drug/metabolite transporter (DMT)-like permease
MGKVSDNIKIAVAFAVIYIVWGTTFLAIRFALETIPPFMMAGIRFLIAGSLLFVWSYYRYSIKLTMTDLKLPVTTGLLMIFVGHGSLAFAEQYISSGFAALLCSVIPVWMVLFSWMQSGINRPDKFTISGILLGIAGVALLSITGKDFSIATSVSNGTVILSIIFLVCSTLFWSFGSLQSRKFNKEIPLLYSISIQGLTGGAALMILSTIHGEVAELSIASFSIISIASLLYLIFFGTILAYSSYVWLLKVSTPAKVGTYAFFNPLIAVFLGWIILNEPITSIMLIGAAGILISVLLINKPWANGRTTEAITSSAKFVQSQKECVCCQEIT